MKLKVSSDSGRCGGNNMPISAWRMENGEWRMENGEWRMAIGEREFKLVSSILDKKNLGM